MKKSAFIARKNGNVEICFDIRALMRLEERTGESVLDMFLHKPAQEMKLSYLAAALIEGVQEIHNEDEALKFIEEFCQEGGSLAMLEVPVVSAIMKTGLITRGEQHPDTEDAKETGNE